MSDVLLPWEEDDEKTEVTRSMVFQTMDHLDPKTLIQPHSKSKVPVGSLDVEDTKSMGRVSVEDISFNLQRIQDIREPRYYTEGFIKKEIDNLFKERHQKFLEVLETKNSWGKNQIKEAFTTIMAGMDFNG